MQYAFSIVAVQEAILCAYNMCVCTRTCFVEVREVILCVHVHVYDAGVFWHARMRSCYIVLTRKLRPPSSRAHEG